MSAGVDKLPHVVVYTDGSSSPNPGFGGWGAILRFTSRSGKTTEREFCGGDLDTTNNRMELFGPIFALEKLTRSCFVTIYTDSQYVARAFNDDWIGKWRRRSWKGVKNLDLWTRLLEATKRHRVEYVWVKGHNGDPGNERADRLALKGRRGVERS